MSVKAIIIDSKVHFGKPCLAGTRIPVYCVLELVQAGIPFNKIVEDYYPDLSIWNVILCLSDNTPNTCPALPL